MKAKIFRGSKKHAPDQTPSYLSQAQVPAHHREPSPGYSEPSGYTRSAGSESALDRSPSLQQTSLPSQQHHLVGPGSSFGSIAQESPRRSSENRRSAYFDHQQPGPQQNVSEERHKRRIRDALGFGTSSRHNQDSAKSLGRSLSVSKRRDSRSSTEQFYPQEGGVDTRSPYFATPNPSLNLLNTHAEEFEGEQRAERSSTQQTIHVGHHQYSGVSPPPRTEEGAERQYESQPAPPSAYYHDARTQDPRSLTRITTDIVSPLPGISGLRSPIEQQSHKLQEGSPRRQTFRPDSERTPGTPTEDGRYPYTQQSPAYQHHGGPPLAIGLADTSFLQPSSARTSLDRYGPSLQQQAVPTLNEPKPELQNEILQATIRRSSADIPPSPVAHSSYSLSAQPVEGQAPIPTHPPSATGSAGSLDSMGPPHQRSNTVRSAPDKSSGSRERAGGQTALYRGPSVGAKMEDRESPGPVELVDEEAAAYLQVQKDFKELKEKYQKVKKYYFEKEAQVHQLQNTLAHQRLSHSRTSLDDSEYAARFQRLDGLISQLSFSIRKNWKTIPDFLHRGVNKDALATGKQEMTAVGKAFMSHWLVTNLFDLYFHPSLELGLSRDLKEIQHNVRRACPPFQSGEEEEALNSKLVTWRLTTIDGLQDRLRSPEASQHHQRLVEMLNEKLVSDTSLLLTDPPPPDLAGGVSMIIELAVAVAQHIPMESRDVAIEYYLPGTQINSELMRLESGIPPLTNPISANADSATSDAADRASLKSTDTRESASAEARDSTDLGSRDEGTKKARGMFGGLMGVGGGGSSSGNVGSAKLSKPPPTSSSGPQVLPTQQPGKGETTAASREERVRMSVGVAVAIRGKSVLAKASVYAV